MVRKSRDPNRDLENLALNAGQADLIDLLLRHGDDKDAAAAIIKGAKRDYEGRIPRGLSDYDLGFHRFSRERKKAVIEEFEKERGLFAPAGRQITPTEDLRGAEPAQRMAVQHNRGKERPDALASAFNETAQSDIRTSHGYRAFPEVRAVLQQGSAKIATAKEYVDWLEGHMRNGGKITNLYNYDTQSRQVFSMIEKDIDLPPSLCGARSVNIIVPKGTNVQSHGIGHCNLYFMDGHKHAGFSVPVHTDVLAEMRTRPFFQGAIGKLEEAFRLIEVKQQDGGRGYHSPPSYHDRSEREQAHKKSQALLEEFNNAFKTPPAAIKKRPKNQPHL